MRFVWDEAKRLSNLAKHGLDFLDAGLVYDSPGKLTFLTQRSGEERRIDIATVPLAGTVLLLVYVEREKAVRIVSFRRASRKEREIYENRNSQPDGLDSRT